VGLLVIRRWPVENPRGRVICTHGMGSSGAEFALLAQRLNALGYDVVCPDWLGHGESQYLWQEGAYRWEMYIRCLIAVTRKYRTENLHFLGVSWGGMMLLLFLVATRLKPRSAIFIDVPLRFDPALMVSAKGLRAQSEAAFDDIGAIERFLYGRRPELRPVPEEWRDYFREARFVLRDGKYVMKFDPAAIAVLENYSKGNFDNFRALERFEFDALFLYGAFSPYRDRARFAPIVAQHPNIRYADTLDAAHPPSLLEPHQFAPIVEFLQSVEGAPREASPTAGL
jgi:pimeloyl-ACP methyl ester carboxylesterase